MVDQCVEHGILQVPAWLAIKQPYFPPGHRENIMKILKNDGEWEELPTRIAKIPSLTVSIHCSQIIHWSYSNNSIALLE